MKARDIAMTLEEFRQYYDSHHGVISSVTAYDAAGGRRVDADRLFREPGAYTLIVVKFKNNTFLRVNVKPSLEVRMSRRTFASAATWGSLGISLTYEEKEYMGTLSEKGLTMEELLKTVEASSFEGKEALLSKLKKASEKMKR